MSSPIATDSFLSWDPAQVSNYIGASIDKSIGPLFLDNNLDGSLLPYLTTEHLRELGIEKLSLRLQVKKAIADLVYKHCQTSTSSTLVNPNSSGSNGNKHGSTTEALPSYQSINNNYVHIESFSLALMLLKESFNKMSADQSQLQQFQMQQQILQHQQQIQLQQQQQLQLQQSLSNPPSPSQQQLDLKKLNENFNKLKSELIPAIRLIKESKPLPTPTLDPGSTLHALESPTFSISSSNTFSDLNLEKSTSRRNSLSQTVVAAGTAAAAATTLNSSGLNGMGSSNSNNSISNTGSSSSNPSSQHTLSNSNSSSSLNGNANVSSGSSGNNTSRVSAYPPSSPTLASNRYSSGSILSMGTGKIIQQSIVSSDQPISSRNNNFSLQKVTNRINNSSTRPRLVETRSANNTRSSVLKPNLRPHGQSVSANATVTTGANGNGNANGSGGNSSPPGNNPSANGSAASTEPLKQLRASSDDSCLKILQQAMKRHHIPRDDWSKYVLVICYGDKERILKLAEKPVIIFKELQELGKHPAIMLRQLATSKEEEEDVLYEDSRIGNEIPGGTL